MDGNVPNSPQDTSGQNSGPINSQGNVITPSGGHDQPIGQGTLSQPNLYGGNQPTVPQMAPSQQGAQVNFSGSLTPQIPQTAPQSSLPSQQPPSGGESVKVTLEDLYGPSHSPAEANPVPQRTDPLSENHPILPPQPSLPPQTQVLERHAVEEQSPQKMEPATGSNSEPPANEHITLDPANGEGGGFHFPSLLLKAIGGIFVILLLIIVFSSVVAFFKNGTSSKDVTLTYWGLWEDSNVFQGVIDDFHRQNPHISINYVKQDPEKYTDRLGTRMQSGTGPDIFRFHNTWVQPLQTALLPLPATVLSTDTLKKNYFPVVSQDLVKNGAVYGLPLQMDTLVLYTNKDIFDHAGVKVPSTWEDFVTVSKGLTVKDGEGHIKTAGAAIGTYENVVHAPDIVSLLLLQNGANLQKLQGSQNAFDALTFYTSFAKSDDKVWDSTLDSSFLAFTRGRVAMYFGYSYDYFAIKAAAPQLHFEVNQVPHLPGRDMSIASYWVEGVSSKSKHPNEAFLFLKYLAQKDVMAKLYTEQAKTRQFGEIYPRNDLASSLSSDPSLAPFVTQGAKAVSSFFASDTKFDSFNGGLNRYLGNAVNSILNNTSADSALESLAQGVTQIFNQYATSSQ